MGRIDAESETLLPINGGVFDVAAFAFDLNQITSKTNCSQPDPAVHHTLPATSCPPHLAQPVAYRTFGDGNVFTEGDKTAPLTTGTDPCAQIVAEPFTIMERGRDGGQSLESRQDGTSNAILTPNGGRGGMGVGAIATAWTVRRLTPVECERLQAFPDQFTRIPYRGKSAEQCPDGPRYKALGNSMAVNVMQLIGERIAIVENAQ